MALSKTARLFSILLALVALLATSAQAKSFVPRKNAAVLTSSTRFPDTHEIDLTNLQKPSTTSVLQTRGGGADTPTVNQITGVSVFILIELGLRKIFKANGITFPAQLAGCVLLFLTLILAQVVSPGLGDDICNALSPGAGFLGKWMGVFFVPGLTMLPLAPSFGSPMEIVKALGVVVVGFYYSLALVSYAVLGVRKLQGAISIEPKATASGGPAKKPYDDCTLSFLLKGVVTFGLLRVALSYANLDARLDKPVETLFFGFVTIASYVWGANLPPAITKVFNPLLTSALVTLGVARAVPLINQNVAFKDVLKSYTCKKLNPLQAGAGDLLLFLLSPSVISFGVGMYKGKQLMATNLPAVVTAVLTGSVGSMFGTAAAARLLNLGGPYGQVIRLAAVPRSTQTALGMTIAGMLGGDIAIAATLIILTGIYGGMFGVKTLDAWGVQDSVSRGLGMGSAGLSLGVVSIKGEPEAFAFAGLCLVLTAVSATCLASVPAIKDLLVQIAGGAPKVAVF